MVINPSHLILKRLRIIGEHGIAYDQEYHRGVNIIRGQNSSGKSTIADFIFFVLGGEFNDWKEEAKKCSEVQAEIETTKGKLTLSRQINKIHKPIKIYFGCMTDAINSNFAGCERYPIKRQENNKSFSQVMFRTLNIPEAQSEGASNITMHQVLRLCYSDQRTPA